MNRKQINPAFFSNVETQLQQLNLLQDSEEKQMRGTAAFQCCAYICDLNKFPAQSYPLHWHNELQLTVAYCGSLEFLIDGRRVILNEGDGIFINARVLHALRAISSEKCERLDLIFNARLLYGNHWDAFYQNYFSKLLNCRNLPYTRFLRSDGVCKDALQYINDAFWACAGQPFGFEFTVREKLSKILLMVIEQNSSIINSMPDRKSEDEKRVRKMLDFIYQNYSQQISLSDIAASANISERESFRCFKRITSSTPGLFLKRHRIIAASQMLEDPQVTILDACFSCGFNSPSYFSKTFREIMHCTPNEYRKNIICSGTPIESDYGPDVPENI